jgi:glycosyltransferase involved in cell wall biosynthesis
VSGHKLRVYNFLKHLSLDHEVTLLCVLSPLDKNAPEIEPYPGQRDILKRLNVHIVRNPLPAALLGFARSALPFACPFQFNIFNSGKVRDQVCHFADTEADVVIFHLARMGQFIPYFSRYQQSIKVLDLVDALALAYMSAGKFSMSPISIAKRVEAQRLGSWEEKHLDQFDHCLVASRRDKRYYHDQGMGSNIEVVPNGVDLEYFAYKSKDDNEVCERMVFVGSFKHKPNCDAVIYFAREIFPIVLRELPDVQLHLVGLSPPAEVRGLQSENVSIFPDVEDVRPFVYNSAISVCPMRFGSGIQNKLLESMAMGTPVVASRVACEGLDAESGTEIVTADVSDPAGFAHQVVKLMRDQSRRKRIAQHARKFVERRHSWELILSDFIQSL